MRALTAVTFIAVVPTVILQVAFVGQRNAGPRALAAELVLGVAHGGGLCDGEKEEGEVVVRQQLDNSYCCLSTCTLCRELIETASCELGLLLLYFNVTIRNSAYWCWQENKFFIRTKWA